MNVKDLVSLFDKDVENKLKSLGYDLSLLAKSGRAAGLAVSGGADSISLLVSFCHLSKKYDIPLKVITVNHNIRSREESSGDADYVVNLGKVFSDQGYKVSVFVKELKEGLVFASADKRGKGIEEAARFLRYQAFEEFAESENLYFLALAHNRNDQLETLLMRFLQGSGTAGLSGISPKRGIFVRPLLDIERNRIEDYLKIQNIEWRTDSTNFDTNYYRNRVRQLLLPFLNENFYGFDKALLKGAEKARDDEEALIKQTDQSLIFSKNNVFYISSDEFDNLQNAVKTRLIYKTLDLLHAGSRVPYYLIKELIIAEKDISLEFNDIVLSRNNGNIELKKNEFIATDSTFFVIIEESERISFPFYEVNIHAENGRAEICFESEKDSVIIKNILLPFCIRSRQQDDFIKTADGGKKSVSDILSDWHVCSRMKSSIPIIQDLSGKNQEIIALVGSVLGYQNWIVKESI